MQRPIAAFILAVLAPACLSSDSTEVSVGDAADTSGTQGPSGTDPSSASGDEGIDSSGGDDGASASDTATAGDTTGGVDPQGAEPCEQFDCGSGTCSVGYDGAAVCSCPDDEVVAGLQCMKCTAVADTYDIELASVDVTIALTIDGAAPPGAATETAALALRNPATGEVIELGDTHATTLVARVIPTVYELVYRRVLGATIPANRGAVLGYVDARAGGQVVREVDIATVRLTGTFAFDGVDAPALPTENGRMWLRNPASGDEIFLGETVAQTFDLQVLPGTYLVEYEALTGAEIAPRNRRARVMTLEVPDDVGAHEARLDVKTVQIGGDFLVDGAATPASPLERARISLRDGFTGDEFPIGDTEQGEYLVRVVAGTYDVVYAWQTGSAVMPANRHAIIGTLDTAQPATHTIDIPTVTIGGGFLIDGEPPPPDANDDGRLFLRGPGGDEIPLGSTTAGGFDRIVVAGLYDVRYAQDTSSGIAPANSDALLATIDVMRDPSFDIDVPTAFVSGTITIGLGAPPESDYDDGWIYLRNAETGDSVLLANTRTGVYGTAIVPGQYQVVYAVETSGGQVPINAERVVVDVVDLAGVTTLDIDVPVRGLGGAIGAAAGPGERGSLYLRPVERDDRSLLGTTVDGVYGQPVIPGRYLVSYGVDAGTGGLPANPNAPLACIDLAGG
jgi:hypothetical protein